MKNCHLNYNKFYYYMDTVDIGINKNKFMNIGVPNGCWAQICCSTCPIFWVRPTGGKHRPMS